MNRSPDENYCNWTAAEHRKDLSLCSDFCCEHYVSDPFMMVTNALFQYLAWDAADLPEGVSSGAFLIKRT